MNEQAKTPRQCYWITGDEHDENGYIPSLVTENTPGHQPLSGGQGQRPWYWGTTLEEANRVCDKANLDTWGVTREQALDIVRSAIDAGPVDQARWSGR